MKQQEIVVRGASAAKLHSCIRAYNDFVAGAAMAGKPVPTSAEEARELLGDFRLQVEYLYPRALRKKMEAGAVCELRTQDGLLHWHLRKKASRCRAVLRATELDSRTRAAVSSDRTEDSVTPGEMNLYAGRHFRCGSRMRDRTGRDDVIKRVTEKVDTFDSTH